LKQIEHLVQVREEDPRYTLRGVNAKPRSKTPSIQNIELALGVLWKQRVVARNMPSAERIYAGDGTAVANLMRELFTALALIPARFVLCFSLCCIGREQATIFLTLIILIAVIDPF